MSKPKNPWEIGPTELIEFALERMHGGSDFDRRLAYLILDVGVETLIKTYLTLPEKITEVVTSSDERYKAAKGNFHSLVDGLQEAVPDKAHDFEIENKRPIISAIVVFKKNPKDINSLWECGGGFYKYARDVNLLKRGEDPQVFHAQELGKIFRYWSEH